MTGKNLFVKISNDRADRFCTITKIIRDEDGKYVLKEPENPQARAHVLNIERNGKTLTELYRDTRIRFASAKLQDTGVRVDWVSGRSFAEYLDELLEQGETEACVQAMSEYFSQMFSLETHEYCELPDNEIHFGTDWPDGQIPAVNGIDIDMLFQNVIYSEREHIWTDYDYEWVLKCDVPVKFLIYRCLNYYLTTEERNCLLGQDLYSRFYISEEEQIIYGKMEAGLQSYIAGDMLPLWKIYERIGGSVIHVLPIVDRRLQNQIAEVFFDKGQGFSVQESKKIKTCGTVPGILRTVLEYPAGAKAIRFDPAQSACIVCMRYLRDAEGRSVSFQTNGVERNSEEYLFLHNDPQIYVSLDDSVGCLELEYDLTIIDAECVYAQNEMGKYQQDMVRKMLECDHLHNQLDVQMSRNEELANQNEELANQNENLENQNQNLRTDLSETQQLFLSLAESNSWRLTEPFRKAGQAVRRQKVRMRNYLNRRLRERYLKMDGEDFYQNWIEELEKQDYDETELVYQPKISILVPVYNVLDKHLIACIESVLHQSYSNWELCMADDCSTWDNVRKTLHKFANNEKVKIVYRSENGHISRATNSALEVATGDYIAFLDCDDVLAPNALYEVAKLLNEKPELDFIYSDEDKIDDDGRKRFMPYFKSDWAPDTLMGFMYTCHLGVYRRQLAVEIGGLRPGFEGAQDFDFTLRFTEKTDRIAHISKVLYHWRVRKESTAATPEAKPYILEAARKSQEEAMMRRGWTGEVELVKDSWQFRVNYFCDPWPKVSVVIPSKDNYDILKSCLDSFHTITDYPDYEIILVDNGSSVENRKKYQRIAEKYQINYIYQKEQFNFSHMCNLGSRAAEGEYLLFLNDDIEIIDEKWLKRMVGQASRDHTGAVGAKLLYPDRDSIQHVGVLNLECGPSHALTGYSDKQIYYFGRNRMDYNYLAVTAACLLVKKSKFEEISGFNEDLAVAYNDVELCFHLAVRGYYNVVRNDAVLLHHESISRGLDSQDQKKMERLSREREKLYELYPQFFGYDPFYNRNLVQNNVDFSCNIRQKTALINRKVGILKPSGINEQEFTVCLDEVLYKDQLCIKGWFYWNNSYWTNVCRMYVALRQQSGQTVCFDVNRMIRSDVAKAGHNTAYNSGFECRISYVELDPQEEYQIGIMVETPRLKRRRICWTSVKTERCLQNERDSDQSR
ncbi:MAG: glycosyltransferase family 2 protein [Clostridiales bacterium]|nr:glycosyltransferase family 2 protein [Clostridiales bacterium]